MTLTRNARYPWTAAQADELRTLYIDHSAAECAHVLRIPLHAVKNKVYHMGLRKPREWIAERARQRSAQADHGVAAHRFQPGATPWNKGVPGSTGTHPKSQANYFKPGQCSGRAAALLLPLGTEVITRDGVLSRKTSEQPGPTNLRWTPVHRLVWEAAFGPVPAGHIVVFKPGRKTTDAAAITPDALELVTRAEHMRRNSVHRHGSELYKLSQLRGAITRQINRRTREEGQP